MRFLEENKMICDLDTVAFWRKFDFTKIYGGWGFYLLKNQEILDKDEIQLLFHIVLIICLYKVKKIYSEQGQPFALTMSIFPSDSISMKNLTFLLDLESSSFGSKVTT